MHTLHGKCSHICAATNQYSRALRRYAHITHYILKRNIYGESTAYIDARPSHKSKLRFMCAMCAYLRMYRQHWLTAAQIYMCSSVQCVQI